MDDKKRIQIITSFFNELDEYCNYAIIHHVDNVFNSSDDIDFVVNCNRSKMLTFVKRFSISHDCFLVNHFTIDTRIYRFDIIYFNNYKYERVELDCACNAKKNNILGVDTDAYLNSKFQYNVQEHLFYKISNLFEIEHYIKKKAFKNGNIDNYFDYLTRLDSTLTKKDIDNKYLFWKKYFTSISFKLKFYIVKMKLLFNRIIEKPDLSIAILGSDGSGKTTIINELKKSPLFINKFYFHLKPIQAPSVVTVVDDPHEKPLYSPLKSYIKLLFFIYQYNVGWVKNILPLKIKSSLIIFDRYYDDILVDYKRYRYGGSMKIAKTVRNLIPKPELYFILVSTPEVIFERKKEVTFKELERQIEAYKLLSNKKNYILIDVNKSVNEIVNEIILKILQYQSKKYKIL